MALAWPNHVHHQAAIRWFMTRGGEPWATTPITQTAFVRISANPAAIPTSVTPSEALAMLDRICRVPGHTFLADDLDHSAEAGGMERVVTHQQVTDGHLLALARRHGGRLATFDRGLASLSVRPEGVVLVRF